MNGKVKCSVCPKEEKRKYAKRINGSWFCKKCYKEKRKKREENIKRNILKISKEQELEENLIIKKDNKRKYIEKNKEKFKKYHREYNKKKVVTKIKVSKELTPIPKIKSIRRDKPRISALGLFITKVEKQVLWGKLKRKGLTSKEANERIEKLCDKMSMIAKKLKEKVKTQEELNIKFREEFAKLIEQD